MPHTEEIKVYLIAKTNTIQENIDSWLTDLGVTSDALHNYNKFISNKTSGELLTELAGRRCYKSFQPRLNPNVTKIREDIGKYLDNVLESAHGSTCEHTTYTFAIENITRVFTGEMNRHRAGVAISEGSMRYIRYEDMPFWMPLSLRDDPNDSDDLARKKMASRQLITTAFQACEAVYRQFQLLWKDELADNSEFHIKKQLTSMMRRIIPMGVCTGGVWTGNLRALRHIFGVRCTEGAEEEICHVACAMLEIMKQEEPLLFNDFEQVEGFYKPKYWKV